MSGYYNISLNNFEDGVIVKGTDTIKFKDTLKELGGKWNQKEGGWFFNLSLKEKIGRFLDVITMKVESPKAAGISKVEKVAVLESHHTEIPKADEVTVGSPTVLEDPKIETYNEKCFIVIGNTRPHKKKIGELGGSWNAKLKNNKMGWVFPEMKRKEVQKWLDSEFST